MSRRESRKTTKSEISNKEVWTSSKGAHVTCLSHLCPRSEDLPVDLRSSASVSIIVTFCYTDREFQNSDEVLENEETEKGIKVKVSSHDDCMLP